MFPSFKRHWVLSTLTLSSRIWLQLSLLPRQVFDELTELFRDVEEEEPEVEVEEFDVNAMSHDVTASCLGLLIGDPTMLE